MDSHELLSFPAGRRIVVDSGYLAAGRHIIYGLLEVDVTRALERRRQLSAAGRPKLSFTAFIAASLGRAIAADPTVQAYKDWRGRLVVFHDVDVVTMIEPAAGKVAIPHILRNTNRRSAADLSQEIRTVQTEPARSEQQGSLMRLAPRFPRISRLFVFWLIKKNPHWFKQLEGTTVVTSVGMFGSGGGWGIAFLPTHTLGLTVGGITQKPGVVDGKVVVRDFLSLTIAFDHDIVDGAPAARFSRRLVELIEAAAGLEEE